MLNPYQPFVSPAFEPLEERLANKFKPDEPGIAVLVMHGGQTLLRKCYGFANIEWQIPISPSTVFRIGSLTKQFTAVLTLMLLEQGNLSLEDPVEKFIPGYPAHGHQITVENLLTHTSGIKSYTSMESWAADWGKNFTLDELISYFKYQPMDFAPGQKWSYNNSGFVLLGAIIEKCAGMPYANFLQETICQPLKMASTCLELPGVLIPKKAGGYQKTPKGYQPAPYISMTQPLGAGGIVSTIEDLAIWDSALYTEQLINAKNLRRAHTPVTLPDGSSTHYGYGWFIHDYDGIEIIDHAGGIHGFVCKMLRIPSERIFAVVLANSNSPSLDPDEITFFAGLRALGLTYPEPEKTELKEEEALKFVGKYEIEPGTALMISYKDAELWLAWSDQDKPQKLIPTGKDEFQNSDNKIGKYRFLMDEAGSAGVIELHNQYNEEQFKAKKLKV